MKDGAIENRSEMNSCAKVNPYFEVYLWQSQLKFWKIVPKFTCVELRLPDSNETLCYSNIIENWTKTFILVHNWNRQAMNACKIITCSVYTRSGKYWNMFRIIYIHTQGQLGTLIWWNYWHHIDKKTYREYGITPMCSHSCQIHTVFDNNILVCTNINAKSGSTLFQTS